MNLTKKLQWGLLALLSVAAVLYPLFEHRYQQIRQKGWITYFPTERQACDLSGAHIFVDNQQRVWVLGSAGCDFFQAAHIFDGGMWEELALDGEHAGGYRVDAQGQLWRLVENSAGKGQGLSIDIEKLAQGRWSTYVTLDVTDERFTSPGFAVDGQGRLWLLFARRPSPDKPALWTTGISMFDGRDWTTYTADNTPSLATERVYGPVFDSQNRAWFLSERGGLKVFDGAGWTDYSPQDLNFAAYGAVVSLTLDDHGDPWIATANGFLVSVDGSQIINWEQGLDLGREIYIFPGGDNFHVAFDHNNRPWIAYWADPGGQIAVFDGQAWAVLAQENSGLSGDEITGLEIDGQGNVWVGTPTGINVFSPAGGELSPLKTDALWIRLRGNQRAFIGSYWLLPFLLFLLWFALFYPKNKWASAIGLLLGLCSGVFLVLAIVFMVVFQGFNRFSLQPLALLIPLGLAGLLVSLAASFQLRRLERKERKLARLGIVLGSVSLGIGLLWRLVASVLLRY